MAESSPTLDNIEKIPDRNQRLEAYLALVFNNDLKNTGQFFQKAFQIQRFIQDSKVEGPWMWDAFHDALADRLHLIKKNNSKS